MRPVFLLRITTLITQQDDWCLSEISKCVESQISLKFIRLVNCRVKPLHTVMLTQSVTPYGMIKEISLNWQVQMVSCYVIVRPNNIP